SQVAAPSRSTAEAPTSAASPAPAQAGAPAPLAAETAPAADASTGVGATRPDLGDQDDISAVTASLRAALPALAAPAPASGAAPAAGEAVRPAPAPTDDRALASRAAGSSDTPCDRAIRDADPSLGPLAYTATLRYRSTPALVLVYQRQTPAGYQAVIVASADCRPLDRAPL
ncbi:MAG: hypothetical protein ACRDZW_03185, partial [Acidimicrobiales bacterium]